MGATPTESFAALFSSRIAKAALLKIHNLLGVEPNAVKMALVFEKLQDALLLDD